MAKKIDYRGVDYAPFEYKPSTDITLEPLMQQKRDLMQRRSEVANNATPDLLTSLMNTGVAGLQASNELDQHNANATANTFLSILQGKGHVQQVPTFQSLFNAQKDRLNSEYANHIKAQLDGLDAEREQTKEMYGDELAQRKARADEEASQFAQYSKDREAQKAVADKDFEASKFNAGEENKESSHNQDLGQKNAFHKDEVNLKTQEMAQKASQFAQSQDLEKSKITSEARAKTAKTAMDDAKFLEGRNATLTDLEKDFAIAKGTFRELSQSLNRLDKDGKKMSKEEFQKHHMATLSTSFAKVKSVFAQQNIMGTNSLAEKLAGAQAFITNHPTDVMGGAEKLKLVANELKENLDTRQGTVVEKALQRINLLNSASSNDPEDQVNAKNLSRRHLSGTVDDDEYDKFVQTVPSREGRGIVFRYNKPEINKGLQKMVSHGKTGSNSSTRSKEGYQELLNLSKEILNDKKKGK
jgi:hypothetical protein